MVTGRPVPRRANPFFAKSQPVDRRRKRLPLDSPHAVVAIEKTARQARRTIAIERKGYRRLDMIGVQRLSIYNKYKDLH
jgi:hypothetical protein